MGESTKRTKSGRTERALYRGLGRREGSALGEGNIGGRLCEMEAIRPVEGRRLLDLGCGNGAYTMRMSGRFDSVVGVDVEPDRIEDFRAVVSDAPIEVILGSAAALDHPDDTFDVVTAIEVMEHLGEHMSGVLDESARLLASGGHFFLTTPNRWWPLEQHGVELAGRVRHGLLVPFLTWVPALHRRLSPNDAFTPSRLDRIVEPHGFRRVGLRYMWPPLDAHPGLRRVVAPLFALLGRTPMRRFAQTLVMCFERT